MYSCCNMAYRLDIYWNDIFISNFDTIGDNPDFVYKEYSDTILDWAMTWGQHSDVENHRYRTNTTIPFHVDESSDFTPVFLNDG